MLLLKQLSLLVSTTFEVSISLQGFVMVDIVLVTRVNSNFIELIHFLFFHGINLCSFNFDLSPLLVLDQLGLQEFFFLGSGFALLVLDQVVLHDFVPGFL